MTIDQQAMTTESSSDEQSTEPDGEPPEPVLRVLIANQQSTLAINEARLQAAVRAIFRDSPYHSGTISIAVVDDLTIHEINLQYLQHDYPTDVLSFVLEDQAPNFEGELVVSTETAVRNATEYNWRAESELLLYVIHGALHLVGYRDKRPTEIAEMHAAEAKCLSELGVAMPDSASRWPNDVVTKESSGEVPPS